MKIEILGTKPLDFEPIKLEMTIESAAELIVLRDWTNCHAVYSVPSLKVDPQIKAALDNVRTALYRKLQDHCTQKRFGESQADIEKHFGFDRF